jgi:hypothetical protein
MPYKIVKVANNKYKVVSPESVHSKETTRKKAEAQLRLLRSLKK